MNIVCIPTQEVRNVWGGVKGLLAPAIERSHGRWTSEYVLAALVLGEQTLWVAIDENEVVGACTVQIATYPERKMLAIHFLGGKDFYFWYEDMLEALTKYGRNAGCAAIECNARHGFWKYFKRDGFERASTFYEKDLWEEKHDTDSKEDRK